MKSYRIALIEDDQNLAQLSQEFLQRYHFNIRICQDLSRVVNFIVTYDPDLILLDISLPYYDGLYWAREIRRTSLVTII